MTLPNQNILGSRQKKAVLLTFPRVDTLLGPENSGSTASHGLGPATFRVPSLKGPRLGAGQPRGARVCSVLGQDSKSEEMLTAGARELAGPKGFTLRRQPSALRLA